MVSLIASEPLGKENDLTSSAARMLSEIDNTGMQADCQALQGRVSKYFKIPASKISLSDTLGQKA